MEDTIKKLCPFKYKRSLREGTWVCEEEVLNVGVEIVEREGLKNK